MPPIRPRSTPPGAPESEALESRLRSLLTELGYRVGDTLGRGGFGVVYAARRESDGLQVAIKVALSERASSNEQLYREAEALIAVGAPHVPAVYEQGNVLDRPFLVLERIDGPILADELLEHAGPLPSDRFKAIAFGILDTLSAIHARGFVHRDLKPENIFLVHTGVKLIDFGLAKRASAAPSTLEVTREEDIGTSEYMSPEQCIGLSAADPRSDIYAIGVLLYEMLTGATPFFGGAADVREAHRSRRPAPLHVHIKCSRELDEVVRRCLAKEPSARFGSAHELRAALERAMGATAVRSLRPPPVISAVAASQPTREKRTMGLIFFESSEVLGDVQSAVAFSGGQVVQADGCRYIAAFGHDVGDNPARIAVSAAERLRASKLSDRLCVDVAAVNVQLRADGFRRVFSPLFSKRDRFPDPADPVGVQLTPAAREVLPDLPATAILGKPERFSLRLDAPDPESITLHLQGRSVVGREGLLQEIIATTQLALDRGEPSVVTIVGEAGHGRTHLAAALGQHLEVLAAAHVLKLTALGSVVGAGSALVPELLRSLWELPSKAPQDGGRELVLQMLGAPVGEQVWAVVSLALGFIDASHPEIRRLAAAPGAMRLALMRAMGEALRRRARTHPLALVLDDAHLADDAVLDALEYATLAEAQARVWICVLVRPNFEATRPTWASRAAHARKFALPPLDSAAAAELARRLLHPIEHVPAPALARLAERTQGIPLLLVELVRGLKRDGIVRASERGSGYYLATEELDKLPELPIVEWNAKREVAALSPRLVGHARLASVLGKDFVIAELDGLLSVLEHEQLPNELQLDATVGVQRLIAAGILVQHGDGRIAFRHSLLRETVYQLIPEPQQKQLHRAAFQMYQTLALAEDPRKARLAFHAALSGERGAAATAYLEIAESLAERHAYLDAEAAYGKALENLSDSDVRLLAAARGRGLMRFRLGRHEDALKDLRMARERASAHGDRTQEMDLLLDESIILDWAMDYPLSASLVRQADAMGPAPSEFLGVRLALAQTRVHHRLGEGQACVRLGAETAARAQRLGDVGYESYVIALALMGFDCANLGRLAESEQHFEACLTAAEARADLQQLGVGHVNRAALWFARKDIPKLFQDLTRAMQIARETGSSLMESAAVNSLAEVAYTIEELDQAIGYSRRAVEVARSLYGDSSREVGSRELLLGRTALYREELSAAREIAAGIRKRMAEARRAGAANADLFPSDMIQLEMIELATAGASEPAWDEFARRAAEVAMEPYQQVELLELRALAARRAGRLDACRRQLEQALELSAQKPNLLSERVERKYRELFGMRDAARAS